MLSGFLYKNPILPQASITLPCLPGLSFAGHRGEQESERFRIVSNEKPLPDTDENALSGSVDARSIEHDWVPKGETYGYGIVP
jgi:hypothetical protein